MTTKPLTMIVRHRVQPGKEEQFDQWSKGIRAAANTFAGFLGTEIIRPLASDNGQSGNEYACIIRFTEYGQLKAWIDSDLRRQWVSRASEFSIEPPREEYYHSLEFWFDTPKAAAPPPRYKMALLSFLVIWVQVSLLVPLISGVMTAPFVVTAAVSVAVIVLLTTYLVMPLVTRLVKGWLYK
ncbi:hypothetical protein QSV34_03645 [Porticoccus sp. W117]|uniref:hypothetical protein n=1 Tax=Porticoccus sp. W117 TaxID=3054777 RepID=UPI002591EFC7|nr:hypothetical protein [Porticoccus sp. W117]MDM3870445.1 hypothetical protein [Porticoccus sp. W117]